MVSRVRASQWALVWAVAFAVVGMHHLATQEQTSHPATVSMTAAVVECCAHDVAEEHTPAPTEHHDSLHLCLAILAAVLGLALTLFALRGRADAERPGSPPRLLAAGPRPPPPRPGGAPALLANLCVLRL